MGVLGTEAQMQPNPHPQSDQQGVEYDPRPKAHFHVLVRSYPPVMYLGFSLSPQQTLLYVTSNISKPCTCINSFDSHNNNISKVLFESPPF